MKRRAKDGPDPATVAVHAGESREPGTGAVETPIHLSNVFVPGDAARTAEVVAGARPGYLYSRWSNPTVDALEAKVAALEGGEAALAAASGMAAITTAILTAIDGKGDHIVAARALYSSSYHVLAEILPRFGVETSLVDAERVDEVEKALRPETRLIYIETPANPTLKVIDIEAIARLGKAREVVTMIDNTFATPVLQQPILLGIDVAIHSATKYLGGHGDSLGGILVGGKSFIERSELEVMRHFGAVLSPFAAWLIARGVKTLPLRVERHSANAMEIACFLDADPRVKRVHYPGLVSHPGHEVAKRQMRAFGGMLAFEVRGGVAAGRRLLDRVQVCIPGVSLGDVRTLITHPASTTHHLVPAERRRSMEIADGLVRVSVGIEAASDLIADLDQALG